MCLAIINSKGYTLPRKDVYHAFTYHGNGAGLSFVDRSGKMNIYLEPDDKADFYREYVTAKKHTSHPMLVHFRRATSGNGDKFLHPFFISDNVTMIHNGIIYGMGSPSKSDTAELVEVLSNFEPEDLSFLTPGVEAMLIKIVGHHNKLAFLDIKGNTKVINEDSFGSHRDKHGNWFSNETYKPYKSYIK